MPLSDLDSFVQGAKGLRKAEAPRPLIAEPVAAEQAVSSRHVDDGDVAVVHGRHGAEPVFQGAVGSAELLRGRWRRPATLAVQALNFVVERPWLREHVLRALETADAVQG